ncbi:hypothetical protein ACTXT7_008729 [Hymenolepis weldensis]
MDAAFTIVVHKDIYQIFRLLHMIYRTNNGYCTHTNSKSKLSFENALEGLGACFGSNVCPQVAHHHRPEKLTACTLDDSFRGTADSAMFRDQSCPHCPFLSLQSPRQIKAHMQLCPHSHLHSSSFSMHIQRLSLVRHIFLRSLLSSILSFPWESELRLREFKTQRVVPLEDNSYKRLLWMNQRVLSETSCYNIKHL